MRPTSRRTRFIIHLCLLLSSGIAWAAQTLPAYLPAGYEAEAVARCTLTAIQHWPYPADFPMSQVAVQKVRPGIHSARVAAHKDGPSPEDVCAHIHRDADQSTSHAWTMVVLFHCDRPAARFVYQVDRDDNRVNACSQIPLVP